MPEHSRVPGALYLCPTPIGNLQDITSRVLDCLKTVELIAAEDTRHTRKLLVYYQINQPLESYGQHNIRSQGKRLLNKMHQGSSVALVTDAGTPGISDPGSELVQQVLAEGLEVHALPGPSAAITALSVSGMTASRFAFYGFLSRKKSKKEKDLEDLIREEKTIVLYESPHRLRKTLSDLIKTLGKERPAAVARELTKLHEEVRRGTLEDHLVHYQQEEPRGEFTMIIAGRKGSPAEITPDVETDLINLQKEGLSSAEAVKAVTLLRGVPRNEVYNKMLQLKKGPRD